MSSHMHKSVAIIILAIFWGQAFACSIAAQGTYWTHDKLIEKTETILLVTPETEDHGYTFKVLEVLKGNNTKELQWTRFRPKDPHRSEDYDSHQDPKFWKEDELIVTRATYYPGACTLQFTFVPGENYLIFKESEGHFHSAEIIKSKNDKWYKYVREKITHKK